MGAVRALGLLDTAAEPRFDRLVRLAARLLGVPLSALSLVDVDRVWFKAAHGLGVREVPRGLAFCAEALRTDDLLVVEDASQDARFASSELVAAPPYIRFYAGQALRAADGQRVGTLCVLDTTPRALFEEERQVLRDLAAIAESELRASRAPATQEFLGVLSHELRTPLNVISGYAANLGDGLMGELTDPQTDAVGKILNQTGQMLAMVDDLLDAAAIQAGQLKLDPDETPLGPIVEALFATLAPRAAARGLALESDLAAGGLVRADGRRLQQVLGHLLDNALKFTEAGGVLVRCAPVEGGKRIDVVDTGCGIAPADQGRLFRAFHQVDMSRTRKAGGTGLGLALTKALVEAHGGQVALRSAPGEGTTVSITLPD